MAVFPLNSFLSFTIVAPRGDHFIN